MGSFGDEIDDILAGADGGAVASSSIPQEDLTALMTASIGSAPPGSPSSGGILSSISSALGTFTRGLLGGSPIASPTGSAAALAQKKAQETTNTVLLLAGLGIVIVGGVLIVRRRSK